MKGEFIFEPVLIRDIPIEIELHSSIFKMSKEIPNKYVPFMIENSSESPFLLKRGRLVGFCEPVSSNINSSEREELKIGNVNTVEVRSLTGEERVKEYDFSQCV